MQTQTESKGRPRLRRALWLVGLVVVFWVASFVSAGITYVLHLSPLLATVVGQLAILLIALIFAVADGDGFRNLGLFGAWKRYDLGVIPGLILVQVIGSVITTLLMEYWNVMPLEGTGVDTLFTDFTNYPIGMFTGWALLTAFLAGLGEELLFRGYLITRLEKIGLPSWICILASALIFGLAHWPGYGLLPSLSKAIWFGIPTGAFFWYRRSLGPLIAAHTLLDFIGFMAVFLLGKLMPYMT